MEALIQKFFDSPKLLLAASVLLIVCGWGLVVFDVIDPKQIIGG